MKRKTNQRAAIRQVLMDAHRPLNAQEVLERAQDESPGIGIATVYRNLKALVASNWLESVELAGEPARYEVRGKDHHHHFRCDSCGKVYDIPGCAVVPSDATPDGFRVERHEVTLFGVCAGCD